MSRAKAMEGDLIRVKREEGCVEELKKRGWESALAFLRQHVHGGDEKGSWRCVCPLGPGGVRRAAT